MTPYILFTISLICITILIHNLPERGKLTGYDLMRFRRLMEKLDRDSLESV